MFFVSSASTLSHISSKWLLAFFRSIQLACEEAFGGRATQRRRRIPGTQIAEIETRFKMPSFGSKHIHDQASRPDTRIRNTNLPLSRNSRISINMRAARCEEIVGKFRSLEMGTWSMTLLTGLSCSHSLPSRGQAMNFQTQPRRHGPVNGVDDLRGIFAGRFSIYAMTSS